MEWSDQELRPGMLVEAVPSAALGFACGFAALAVSGAPLAAAVAALAGAEFGHRLLDRIAVEPGFDLAAFKAAKLDEAEELLLTLDQRIDQAPSDPGELLLEDRLPPPGTDSRVIRLFDVRQLTGPGELHARVERQLRSGERPAAATAHDDSAALHDALAELKRSLR